MYYNMKECFQIHVKVNWLQNKYYGDDKFKFLCIGAPVVLRFVKEAKGLSIKTDKQQRASLPKNKQINRQNSTELVMIATEGRAGVYWV